MATALVKVVAMVLVLDGAQAVMAQALRGRRDVWMPMAFQIASYLGVMVPTAYMVGIVMGQGVLGLIWTVFGVSCLTVSLQAGRFAWLDRRPLG